MDQVVTNAMFRFGVIVTGQSAPPVVELVSPATFQPHLKGLTPQNNCETSVTAKLLFLYKKRLN